MQEPEATIVLPSGENGGSFVTVAIGPQRVTVQYTPAQTALILALNATLHADDELDPPARGWRTAHQISMLLTNHLEEPSLRRAISTINQRFRATGSKLEVPVKTGPLIKSVRKTGIRLAWHLSVVRK